MGNWSYFTLLMGVITLFITASGAHLVGGGFKYVLFYPYLGGMIRFDEQIFTKGLKLETTN